MFLLQETMNWPIIVYTLSGTLPPDLTVPHILGIFLYTWMSKTLMKNSFKVLIDNLC